MATIATQALTEGKMAVPTEPTASQSKTYAELVTENEALRHQIQALSNENKQLKKIADTYKNIMDAAQLRMDQFEEQLKVLLEFNRELKRDYEKLKAKSNQNSFLWFLGGNAVATAFMSIAKFFI